MGIEEGGLDLQVGYSSNYSVMARSASGLYVAVRADGWCWITRVLSSFSLSFSLYCILGCIFSFHSFISLSLLLLSVLALLIQKIKHANCLTFLYWIVISLWAIVVHYLLRNCETLGFLFTLTNINMDNKNMEVDSA